MTAKRSQLPIRQATEPKMNVLSKAESRAKCANCDRQEECLRRQAIVLWRRQLPSLAVPPSSVEVGTGMEENGRGRLIVREMAPTGRSAREQGMMGAYRVSIGPNRRISNVTHPAISPNSIADCVTMTGEGGDKETVTDRWWATVCVSGRWADHCAFNFAYLLAATSNQGGGWSAPSSNPSFFVLTRRRLSAVRHRYGTAQNIRPQCLDRRLAHLGRRRRRRYQEGQESYSDPPHSTR